MTDRTHFGYQDVAREAKAGLVRDVFDNVAGRYDLMNDLMSAGVHRRWKDAALDWLAPQPHQHLLDVAGGTGDIAFRFLERGGGAVTVCDINEKMLAEGRRRANDQLLGDKAKWPSACRSLIAVSMCTASLLACATSPISSWPWRKPSVSSKLAAGFCV